MQQPYGSEVETKSIGDKGQIAAEGGNPERNHLPHAKGRQYQRSGQIADQIPRAHVPSCQPGAVDPKQALPRS
jgi:hypothetical protein